MELTVRQIASTHKVRGLGIEKMTELKKRTAMKGEYFSYQIAIQSPSCYELNVEIESPLKEYIKAYVVKDSIVDFPTYPFADDQYITKEPGTMPDILMPLELENNMVRLYNSAASIWITVILPREIDAGVYPINVKLSLDERFENTLSESFSTCSTFTVDVIDRVIPEQKTEFTQWFHVDCIADVHNVSIYSEEHWALIDKYMALASELGFTMILTPVITPPLDTAVGTRRPCTQLVKIFYENGKYSFDFSLLERWVKLAQKNKIKGLEISHLFSQWGLAYTPNIKVVENGVEDYKFGWHVEGRSPEYKEFLTQFLPTLVNFFKEQGIKDNCWFHVSDEPHIDHLEAYKYGSDLVKSLIDGCHMFDALSDYEFYKQGLVEYPVTAINFLEPFIENNTPHQFAYYCCGQYTAVSNRFLAQESYKNRIIGIQMYKYNIEGFLQWGFNFYYNQLSRHLINPYITTSADRAFPSGDAFSVYPINNGVVPSLRASVFREALNDIEVCRALAEIIGRDKVIELIDKDANVNVTFKEYPHHNYFLINLIEKMERMIKEHTV